MLWYLQCLLLLIFSKANANPPVIYGENVTYIPSGTNATFRCKHDGEDNIITELNWSVHDDDDNSLSTFGGQDKEKLDRRGIFKESINDSYSILTVLASQLNNGSYISCSIFMHDGFSETVTMIVIGPPLAPVGLHTSLITATEIMLEWEEASSWPDYDILYYIVTTVVFIDDSEMIHYIDTTTTNQTSYSYNMSDNSCMDIIFMVSAVSDLGNGTSANLSTGFPQTLETIGNVSTNVLFEKDGSPQVTITLKPPPVCDYQTVDLMVEIVQIGPVLRQNYGGQPPELSIVFDMGLERNRVYNIVVSIYTVTGNISDTIEFDTFPKEPNLIPYIVGSVSGALVVLLTVLLIFICCRLVTQPKHATQTTDVDNGRDSIYEYIDDTHVTNQYHQHTRPESPYQAMNPADPCCSFQKSIHDSESSCHYANTLDGPYSTHLPNFKDVHVTPGGSVLYLSSRESAATVDFSGEGEYTTMSAIPGGQQQHKLEHTLPDIPLKN